MKTLWLIISVFGLVLSGVGTEEITKGADFTWAMKKPMQQSRSNFASVELNGKIYAIAGYVGGYTNTSSVEEYDPVADTWSYKDPIANAVHGLRAAVVNGKIYAFGGARNVPGGAEFISTVEEYDPSTDKWTPKEPMSEKKYMMAIGVLDDKIYIVGGSYYSSSGGWEAIGTVEVYDPSTDQWETEPREVMPDPRHPEYSAAAGGKIYVFVNPANCEDPIRIYDPTTDTWSTDACIPIDIFSPATAVINDTIYAFGGSFNWPTPTNNVYEYAPQACTWCSKEERLITAVTHLPAASVIDNKVYVLGGQTNSAQSSTLVQEGTMTSNRPPVAICQNVTKSADEYCEAVVTPEEVDNGSYDPDEGDTITLSLAPPGPYQLGETLVTLTVTDDSGESDQCVAIVTVVDMTPPTIICPDSITLEAQSASGVPETNPEVLTFLTGASASDNCDPLPVISDDAPDQFPLGETIVTFSAADALTNTSSCEATVTVQDTTPPVITIVAPEPYGLYPVGDLALDFSAEDSVSGQLFPPDSLWGTLTDAAGYSGTVYPDDVPGVGVYTLVVSAKDEAENRADSEPVFFVVYNPTGGFVTGGGWIYSEPGAYRPDTALEGKANFGFISKYKKGATTPTGQTEFVFHAGDLNFHSSSYDWLVVTGSDYARFKGWGSINGYGDYRFMLWAGDGPDTFRIKIWYEDGEIENVVYDNGMDQQIGGGSIVIHTK